MRSEIEVFPLYFPGVRLSDSMLRGRNIFSVTLPIIGIITGYPKNGKFLHQKRAALIRPSSVMPCEYHTGLPFNRVPRPPLIFFIADITPKFISFGIRPYFNFQFVGT